MICVKIQRMLEKIIEWFLKVKPGNNTTLSYCYLNIIIPYSPTGPYKLAIRPLGVTTD